MGFSRQEHWSGVPFPPPADLSNPGIKPASAASAGGFFTAEPPGKPWTELCPLKTPMLKPQPQCGCIWRQDVSGGNRLHEVIRVGPKATGPVSLREKEETPDASRSAIRRKNGRETTVRGTTCKRRREASWRPTQPTPRSGTSEPPLATRLISAVRNSRLWCSVTAALANECTKSSI